MERKTVALGLAAVAAVAAAVIVTLTNHSSVSPKHKAVVAYITRVNTIEQQEQPQLTATVRAYHDFARGHVPARTLAPRLVAAEDTLVRLQHRLAVVPTPPEAKRLHRLLVELLGAEAATAHEISGLEHFAPEYAHALARAKRAGTALSAALAAVSTPQSHVLRGTKRQVERAQAAFTKAAGAAATEQADAVDAYDRSVARVEQSLRRITPPTVMRPAYLSQVRTLRASRLAGAALADELRKSDRSQVAVYGRRFTLAAREAGSLGAQEAQIAAVKAYNRRVNRIGSLEGRIQLELQRLQAIAG